MAAGAGWSPPRPVRKVQSSVTWRQLNVLDARGGLVRLSGSGGHHLRAQGSDSSTGTGPHALQNCRAGDGGRCPWSTSLNDGFGTFRFAGRAADAGSW